MGYHSDGMNATNELHFAAMEEPVMIHRIDAADLPTTGIVDVTQSFRDVQSGTQTIVRASVAFNEARKDDLSTIGGVTFRGSRFEIQTINPPVDGDILVEVTRADFETTRASTALDPLT